MANSRNPKEVRDWMNGKIIPPAELHRRIHGYGSPYAWVITRDHIEGGEAEGVSGPSTHRYDISYIIEKGEAFKIYDDDGILYYEGRIVGEYDGFEPLDDFGTPGAGATTIKYRNKTTGRFESL